MWTEKFHYSERSVKKMLKEASYEQLVEFLLSFRGNKGKD